MPTCCNVLSDADGLVSDLQHQRVDDVRVPFEEEGLELRVMGTVLKQELAQIIQGLPHEGASEMRLG